MDAIKFVEDQMLGRDPLPDFKVGDNVSVNYKIVEGEKERIQIYRGDVIQIKGQGKSKMFTVRKISGNVGVERIFPSASENIVGLEINKRGKVRRARLFYLRELIGKKAKIKEKTTLRK